MEAQTNTEADIGIPHINFFIYDKESRDEYNGPGTRRKNIGTFTVKALDRNKPDELRFIVSVVRAGTDYMYSNYLKKGSSEQIRNFMFSEEGFEEIFNSVYTLSDKVDQFFKEAE